MSAASITGISSLEVFVKLLGHNFAYKAKAERVDSVGVWFSGKILESLQGLPSGAMKVDPNKPIGDLPKYFVFIPFQQIEWIVGTPFA
jgi:hypothetical protein